MGLFISFEGSEGCGKSTQIERLTARLTSMGRQPVVTREPGGTPIGEELRHLLQFSSISHGMRAETELLLFAASRAQLVRELIQPALKESGLVIADRFFDSTTVYQGVARKLDPATVELVNRFAIGDCVPDITFLLDLNAIAALERLRKRGAAQADRMEKQSADFYEAVRRGYLQLAERESARICVLDAARTADEIEQEIWTTLTDRFDGILKKSGV
jgi:dTMP kinase